jgi:hypothetical protein
MNKLRGTITLFALASLGAPLAYPLLTRMGGDNMAIAANSYIAQRSIDRAKPRVRSPSKASKLFMLRPVVEMPPVQALRDSPSAHHRRPGN